MATIPHDIIHGILLSLPPKSLVRFKCICKAWKHHIECADFIRNLLYRSHQPEWDHSSLILTCVSSLYLVDDLHNPSPRPRELALPRSFQHNNGTIKVVGSCNGLLCIASGEGSNHYFLCNPSNPTSSFKILPFAHNGLSRQAYKLRPYITPKVVIILGFGYDHLGDDCKIVYGWGQPGLNNFEVLLYSLIAGSWEFIENPGFEMGWHSDSVLFNNCLHWIISKHKIIYIDLHDELWYEFDLPDSWLNYIVQDLGVFGGFFGAILLIGGEAELWVMRDYDENESWERLFTLPDKISRVIYYSMRGDQALLLSEDDAQRELGWYCLREKKIVQRVELQGDVKFSRVKSFVGSLVPVVAKRMGQEHEDEGNSQESILEDIEADVIGESSSTRNKGRR